MILTETVDDNGETDMELDERFVSEIVFAGNELTQNHKFTEMIVNVAEFFFLLILLLMYFYCL